MTDRRDTNRLPAIGQLIDDPIGADSQRIQAPELAAKRIAGERIALENSKRVLDRVDQRPIKAK